MDSRFRGNDETFAGTTKNQGETVRTVSLSISSGLTRLPVASRAASRKSRVEHRATLLQIEPMNESQKDVVTKAAPAPAVSLSAAERTPAARAGAVLFRQRGWLPILFLGIPLVAPGSMSPQLWVIGIALVVVGPKDLPRMMRTMAQWAGKGRSVASDLRRGLQDLTSTTELDGLRTELNALKRKHPLSSLEEDLKQPIIDDRTPRG